MHTTWPGVDTYDWSFTDLTCADLRRRTIMPIVDLCHFGVPDWLDNFYNMEFSILFTD